MNENDVGTELKLPFIEFDYLNDLKHNSRVKQAVLYMAEIEKIFNELGILEINKDILNFVKTPFIRKELSRMVDQAKTLDLKSRELPFLMRVEIAEAYFHYKLSNGLTENFELYVLEFQRNDFSENIGFEVIKRMQASGKSNSDLECEIQEILKNSDDETKRYIYDVAFGEHIDRFIEQMIDQKDQSLPETYEKNNSLVFSPSSIILSGLQRDSINASILNFAIATDRFASDKEVAIYNDQMRKILQNNGVLNLGISYNGMIVSSENYQNAAAHFKRAINNILVQNLMDGEKILETMNIFPGEIDQALGQKCINDSLLSVRDSGVIFSEGKFYFDNNTSRDLERVAKGAQHLINRFAEINHGIAISKVESASRMRRDENPGFLEMLSRFSPFSSFDSVNDIPKSKSWFEYFNVKLKDREEFYKAYKRLYETEGYEAYAKSDSRVSIKIQLSKDGRVWFKSWENLHEDSENVEWMNPFEYIEQNRDNESINYFLSDEFIPAMEEIKKLTTNEIYNNEVVKQKLSISTDNQNPIQVDEGLFYQVLTVASTTDRLSESYECLNALKSLQQKKYEAYMRILGLNELSEEKVKLAYVTITIEEGAHPDLTLDPIEKITKGRRMNELLHAKNELLRKLSGTKDNGIVVYLGNISSLLAHQSQ